MQILKKATLFIVLAASGASAQSLPTPDFKTLTLTSVVSSNAQLSALASTTAASVTRLGFAAAQDAPPVVYTPSASACSLNSGAGDGGSQVPTSDGKCWLAAFPPGPVDAREFGVSSDTSDNAPKMQAALNYLDSLSTGARLSLPSGLLLFGASVTATLPAGFFELEISGAGKNATILSFSGTGGLVITGASYENSFALRDFSVATSTTNNGKGIYINQTATVGSTNPANGIHSVIDNVSVRGADGLQGVDYWTDAVYINNWSSININDSTISGTNSRVGNLLHTIGASILGPIAGPVNLQGDYFLGGNYQLYEDVNTQGITVNQSNFNQGNVGIYCPSSTGTDQTSVTGSAFSEFSADVVDNGCYVMQFTNNFFYATANGAIGIIMQNAYRFVIEGNQFDVGGAFTNTTAVQVLAEIAPGSIANNTFSNVAIAVWYPNAGTFQDRISNNVYSGVTTQLGISTTTRVISDVVQPTASLPACAVPFLGRTATVTDSSVTTWGSTLAGGGSNYELVFCDNGYWTVAAR